MFHWQLFVQSLINTIVEINCFRKYKIDFFKSKLSTHKDL